MSCGIAHSIVIHCDDMEAMYCSCGSEVTLECNDIYTCDDNDCGKCFYIDVDNERVNC